MTLGGSSRCVRYYTRVMTEVIEVGEGLITVDGRLVPVDISHVLELSIPNLPRMVLILGGPSSTGAGDLWFIG